jgi:hypothetical protein
MTPVYPPVTPAMIVSNTAIWESSGWQPPLRILSAGILIILLLGILWKYVRSGGFHDLIEDICFMLSAIEREGRDGRPWQAQPSSSQANVDADMNRLEIPGQR